MFSNNVVDSGVTHSEFVHIGDSAVATLGSTDRIFGHSAHLSEPNTRRE